jgi:hypothetical protein
LTLRTIIKVTNSLFCILYNLTRILYYRIADIETLGFEKLFTKDMRNGKTMLDLTKFRQKYSPSLDENDGTIILTWNLGFYDFSLSIFKFMPTRVQLRNLEKNIHEYFYEEPPQIS